MAKKIVMGVILILVLGCAGAIGCNAGTTDREKLSDLEFTVVGEHDVPQTLQDLIKEKKSDSFKLTYADGQDMYIVIGAGQQECGGHSIIVKELYLTENSIVYKTELLGPENGDETGKEPSYPVLIIKTAFREEPVVFK